MSACLLAATMVIVHTAEAITADNPYTQTITNRNLFGLKPPVDPATLIAPPPPPNVPKVMLTGITTLMGGKRCILRVPRAARQQEPAKEVSLFKAEGDPAEEGIQVLEIDLASARVKINNNGTMQTLDLAKDAPKAAAVAATPAGLPAIPRPGGVGAVIPPPPTAFVGRPLRGAGGGVSEAVTGAGPSRAQTAATASDLPQIPSAEDQVIMMEAWRLRDKEKIAAGIMKPDDMPPYPPTELQEEMEREQQGTGAGSAPTFPGIPSR